MTIPNNINREHILQAIQEIDKEGIPPKRESTKFALVWNGKLYPPKYTASIANKYANQQQLPFSAFSGGDEANAFLNSLDFTIIEITNFDNTIQTLKGIYDGRSGNDELVMIINSKNEVVEKYQRIFSKKHIPHLTEDELSEFLSFKNNKHWIGLQRQKGRLIQDMDELKTAFSTLVDESLPIQNRLDTIRPKDGLNPVPGMKEALSTAILHVSYPEKYGVWNSKSEGALKKSGLYPKIKKRATFGETYTAINEVLNALSKSVDVDLWTLDALLFVYDQKEEMEYISEIEFQTIIKDTITIAETIKKEGLEGERLSQSTQSTISRDKYHRLVKPLIESFQDRNNGNTPNIILATILNRYVQKTNITEDFEVQKFHFHGHTLKSYVWAAITKRDDTIRDRKVSHFPQLYILINTEGIKFGFDYGDQIKPDEPRVTAFQNNNKIKAIVNNILLNNSTLRVYHENSPNTLSKRDSDITDQLLNNNFDAWSNDIIIIESHEKDRLPENLIERIETVFDALFPIFQLATYADDDNKITELLDSIDLPAPIIDLTWKSVKERLGYTLTELDLTLESLYFEEEEERRIQSQIATALQSGKHIILIGPPGTGKSKLAKEICEIIVGQNNYQMATASSDWSTYETIGGYRHDREGTLKFYPGIFLRCFQDRDHQPINKWLVIDEINRADIDKAFGALFSALTGDSVTIPFEIDDEFVEIIGRPSDSNLIKPQYFIIHPDWRIIATMNTFDKSSLYEMSYAFMRRFALININTPSLADDNIIMNYTEKWGIDIDAEISRNVLGIWRVINQRRKIGPAIIYDVINYVSKSQPGSDGYAASIVMYILPQFEGLADEEQIGFIKDLMSLDCIRNDEKDYIRQCASEFFNISIERF